MQANEKRKAGQQRQPATENSVQNCVLHKGVSYAGLARFLKSRTQKDTTELHEALQKLWHKCPRHLQWKQKASTKATSKTGASDLTSAMQVRRAALQSCCLADR